MQYIDEIHVLYGLLDNVRYYLSPFHKRFAWELDEQSILFFFQSISNKKGDLRYKFCSERVYCSSKQMSQLYLSRFCFFFSQKNEVLSFFFLLPWYTSRIYLPLRLCIIQTLEVKVLFIFSDEYQIYFNLVVHMKLLYYIT